MTDPIHPNVTAARGASRVVLACEHAINAFPAPWGRLGLPAEARAAHIAWDPGAMAVARRMAATLGAALVEGTVSRLIYDCNRPPEAPDAIPVRADGWDVPGNAELSPARRAARAAAVHDPFHAALAGRMAACADPVLVTVHSFTPVLAGRRRATQVGLLHDADDRLARAMAARAPAHLRVALNDPYGPEDGVTHTLRRHATPGGRLNVMLEIRSDLLDGVAAHGSVAHLLCNWLTAALEDARCSA